ncbi:putative membrane protein [Xanthomonas citri pv. fuscans]|nr:putative membrane protein [Xanthomonas citri pv. fuscans]SOO12518.1 putative membrane protein [Xanthomonas citri pv. fuscans]SOO20422.1 putative membrane protein [Xanthomonas citri pv. fuscans]
MLMSGIVRNALSAAVSFGVAWGGSIFYWRSSGTTPNGMEMLTYLGILPASLLGGSWLLRDMGRRSLSRATDAADSAAAKAVEHSDSKAAAASSSSLEAPPATGARPALLAGAVNLALGQQPQAILALRGNLPRPVLHKQFRDRDGLPVFVVQVPDLATSDAGANERPLEHHTRAIALLEPIAEALLLEAAQALPPLPEAQDRLVAGLRHRVEAQVQNVLRIELWLPADWPASLHQALGDWMLESASEHGLDPRRFGVEVIPMAGADHAWSRLQGLARGAESAVDGWQLIMACHSTIDQAQIEQMLESGRLMTRRSPDGRVPGEGASGILLASGPGASGDVLLHPLQRVGMPLDSGAKTSARLTGELAAQTLQRAALAPTQVDLVLSDADHRANLAAEAAAAAALACPDLDTALQCLPLAAATGDLAAVQPLVMLALAHAHVAAGRQAVLMLGVDQAGLRIATLVSHRLSPQQDTDVGAVPASA